MVSANDLKGIMTMMPAFTTKDGDRIDATDTVDTDELTRTVDKIIRDDGCNLLTTTGSFGEFHTLLWDEHKKLIEATVAAAKKRVPVFIGCTNLNPREAIRQAKFAQEAGADGLLLGVPFYYQASVENAVQFYHDVADALPKMGVMIYHNPTHHRVTIPVSAFKKLTEKPNIVGMKDSHRTPLQFVELSNITKGKMSIFVNQTQMFPYYQMGAAGCWSFNVWMGPSPVIALRDACSEQNWDLAKQICLDLEGVNRVGPNIGNLVWRENVFKLAVNHADYCSAGPLRAPWRIVPQEVTDNSKKIAAYWKTLCEKYPMGNEKIKKSA
ncbi:MAG TPA: dihydrodipicolinate synthase family protein [Candidatus Binatus sp.]|nr:dihydrodipicolinate synthase family protein [Candidatus Binatus sp.]